VTPDDWHITHDLAAFLDRSDAFLRSRPALHTVPLTLADGMRRRGTHVYGAEDPVFGTLERDGAVRAVFLRTPPWWLTLTPLTEEEADSLAVRLAAEGHALPGVSAERDTAAAFAGAWQRRTGTGTRIKERQRLYRLGELTPPRPAPPGRARLAGPADRDRLITWFDAFMAEIGQPRAQDAGAWADSRVSHGGVTFWETPDGTPAAMAGVTVEVAGQIRVAPVYTPPELRGRGYAGAATTEVSRVARDSGAEVLLFTDLSNPTTNGLYQRIGYRPVADFAVHEFAG
jgi:predicted GNAT family acetyltransferase